MTRLRKAIIFWFNITLRQGLIIEDSGMMIETTGLYGESSIRRINPNTGEILLKKDLNLVINDGKSYFGEGICQLRNGSFLMLTWKEHVALLLDAEFNLINKFSFQSTRHEGWGLACNSNFIILSDGSHTLHYWSPDTLQESYRRTVVDDTNTLRSESVYISHLNELEFVGEELLANIFGLDLIARINPNSAKVIGYYNFSQHRPAKRDLFDETVLNGIAYDSINEYLYITGKRWKYILKVVLP